MRDIYNPLAPPAVAGIPETGPAESDMPFSYVYDVTLSGGEQLLAQQVPIDNDSDFVLRGIYYSWPTGTNGTFTLRLYDAQNFALSNGPLYNTNYSTDPSAPTVVGPELNYPAGNKLQLDITDVSGFGNTIEIVFIGVKRYRLS
jgi:hypothetical protein